MKKILSFITVYFIALSLFATDDHPTVVTKGEKKISKQALVSFNKDYKDASAVTWETGKELYFAYFTLNREELVAAYDEEGNAISVSRYIEFNNLPLNINMAIKEKFPDYQKFGSVAEIVFDGYTVYYFSLMNDKKVIRIKVSPDGYLNVIGKQKILKQ
jgi:hypothetical protein